MNVSSEEWGYPLFRLYNRKKEIYMAEKKNIAERVMEIAVPVAQELGLSVWDVFYGKEGQNMIMRITIDKPEGIGIQDCEKMSRAVDPMIDAENLTTASYSFEVSSPGLGRRIHTEEQFRLWTGKPVLVRLVREDADHIREYRGELSDSSREQFSVITEDGTKTFSKSDVAYVKADDDNDI